MISRFRQTEKRDQAHRTQDGMGYGGIVWQGQRTRSFYKFHFNRREIKTM